MGIVVFLLEKSYMEETDSSIIKSDLIYRVLIEQNNIHRFQNQIKLFEWTGSEELTQINIADHLSPFIVHKSNYDIQEITKIKDILLSNPSKQTKELREQMGYPNTRLKQLLGYKDHITGLGRNTFLLN